jgi:hypothetical protein
MRSLFACALGLMAVSASAAQYYTTTGMIGNIRPGPAYDSNLDEMARYGIRPQLIVVVDGGDSTVPGQLHGYQLTAQAMNTILNDAQQRTGQRKVALDLFNLFFYTESFKPGQEVPCPGYQLPAGSSASPLVNFIARLRKGDANGNGQPDYRDRMADFRNLLGAGITAANFEFISVNPESGCVHKDDIDLAALAVKDSIPTAKVAAGYEISIDAGPESHIGNGVNHVGQFASRLDRVLTWSYGVMNPANDLDPLNANATFTRNFNALRNKLRPWQTIDLVIDAHYINGRHGLDPQNMTGLRWTLGTHHARLAVNWCNWARGQPLVNGLIAFTYGPHPGNEFFSLAEMPQIVRDTHANLSAGQCSQPDTLLAADAFTLSPAGSAFVNTALHNRRTEVGNLPWTASGAVIGTTPDFHDGHVNASSAGANPMATVPVSNPNNRPLTLTADINPQGAEWVALGLSGAALQGWFGNGQLWVYLKNSQRFNVMANGTAISLSGGERFDARIRPNAINRVELFYTPATRTVSVRINGYVMLPATTLPAGYTPVTNVAGWSALAAGPSMEVDSFELRRR